ncbi:3'-5' exonuclease [Microvirgula aerodenitrificans]|uniref:3'-5' exonuclease n=1 Tax=Microvirgula aerodenitrificans TaxID=57480 RepID=UPI0028F0CEB8|nr:3'-5' exonuclease [Microvirgula aerodenitrificans]
MHAVLAFDIETIPDISGLRAIHDLSPDMPDTDVAEWALQRQRARNGSDFLPHHLHRAVAISCVLRWGQDKLHIATLGSADSSERDMIAAFFALVEKYTPQLVSWNGGGFDLPALQYRALINGIAAPRYWDQGDGDYADSRDFKWNNYISRYHSRHLDLMDVMALYQPRASAPLDDIARLCGFPGKLGMDGSKVWQAFQDGRINDIRDYCETDAANTYLVFLRFQLLRGALSPDEYAAEVGRVRDWVAQQAGDHPHWQAFVGAWPAGGRSV